MSKDQKEDETKKNLEFMRLAIEEAKKSDQEHGKTPLYVGAVVVKEGKVLDKAYRGEISRGEHAEYTLLERKLVDTDLSGATLYTTLEPCTTRNHPKLPCAKRIVQRRIGKVVIGIVDPNDTIRGRGVWILTENKVAVEHFSHELQEEIRKLNQEFIREHLNKRTEGLLLDVEHFDLINDAFLNAQPKPPTIEAAFKVIHRYEWGAANLDYLIERKALNDALKRIEERGRTPGIIPINGTGGSGKTVLLKQCAVALYRQNKSVLFPKPGHSESIEFKDIEELNEIALEKNCFLHICLDDFHKFPNDIQNKIIDTAEYWNGLNLLIAYRDPVPGIEHKKIQSYRPINLDSQKDIPLFIKRLQEISQSSPDIAQLLKEKQPLIERASSDKPLRLFVFLYLFFDRKIYDYDDPELAFRTHIQEEYEELKKTDKRLAQIVKSATIWASYGYYLPLETIREIHKDDLLTDRGYYTPIEHLFYISSSLTMDVLLPAHDVIINALIRHHDMKYKGKQKQEILNILKHSIGREYAHLLNSMIYHRDKVDLSIEELEPYIGKGLDQGVDGAYLNRWASLLFEEKGQSAGFEFAKNAILRCNSKQSLLLSKYLGLLPFEERYPFAKQMIGEGIKNADFLVKCLDVLPEGERYPFAKQMIGEGIKNADFLVKCLDVLPKGERYPFAKRMIGEGIKHPYLLMKYLDVLPEGERYPFAKQMIEEGIKHPYFLTKCLDVLPKGEQVPFAKRIIGEGMKDAGFLMKCLDVLPEGERVPFAKRMIGEGIKDADFLMKCLDVLPEGERYPFAKQMIGEGIKHPPFLIKCLGVLPEGERVPFAKRMIGEGMKDADFLMKCLDVLPKEERASFAKLMVEKEGINHPYFLMKYLDVLPEEERLPFAKQMVKEGIRDTDFLMKCLDILPEGEQEDLAWRCLQNPIKSIAFLGKCLLAVQNKDPNILREIVRKNFKMIKSPYSIPFWKASLCLFEGCKEFKDVLLHVERFPAVKNNISLSTHLVPLYSRIGDIDRKLCYWHSKNLKNHIDDHPMNRFSLALAYFYERKDVQAQNEFRLLQTRQDAIALLSQLYLAWIDERNGKFDSKEIVELEACLKSGKFRGNLLILTNQLLARVYAQKGKFNEADEIMSRVQYNYKTEALHYYTLGVIEELKTNISNAQSHYQKYLSIPNGKFHLNGLYISSLLKKTLNNLNISYPYRFEI